MPESSAVEAEMATGKLKRHKSPGGDQTWAQLIKSGGRKMLCEIHKLFTVILLGIRRNCLSSGRSWSLYLFIRPVIKKTIVIIQMYHSYQIHTIAIKG
jgi:hypothetical protein